MFKGRNREEVYGWVNQTLQQQRYGELKRSGRGQVRRYLAKMTGLGRAQITRLVTMYQSGEEVKPKPHLVDTRGFTGGYQSVKRFVRKLAGGASKEACAVIETGVGEEATGPMVRDPHSG